ncbi:hypothetical protein HDIA_1099 [Hartmannibacter diazotrophicus]|uniref:Uncharacterized protein n=1 Tax=Hartmannibacter diazotrophicus TaxID=1482074 RepID=A0A2C9D2Z9_9HYPH|nr:DUF6101 family protein [Hartmannibacter diazotrophicus]SON54640.1 hypothetical protein HDIA_1099 [Hartmannibacter diazotrophicus]
MTGARSSALLDQYPNPRALPARFRPESESENGQSSGMVYVDGERVVIQRQLSGLPLTVAMHVSHFQGIAVSIVAEDSGRLKAIVELAHRDPDLTIPLMVSYDMEEVSDAWEAWADVLGLPMLLRESDGQLRPVEEQAEVRTGRPLPRRQHTGSDRQRPRFLVRRKAGHSRPMPVIEGTEIIARN